MASFYLEAIVGVANVASQRVASKVLGGPGRETIDGTSGDAALAYTRFVTT